MNTSSRFSVLTATPYVQLKGSLYDPVFFASIVSVTWVEWLSLTVADDNRYHSVFLIYVL